MTEATDKGRMNELSLFTGGCGGLLGTYLLGWRPVGYVEIGDYPQQIIAQRIRDGFIPVAPIFTDVCQFVESGFARQYRGFVDVVTGGDPCQDNSAAAPSGSPQRSLGGEFIEVVREVEPRYVLRENPAVTRVGAPWPADKFADALESLGYLATPFDIGACCVGGDHRRKRRIVFAEKVSSDTHGESKWEAAEIVRAIREKLRAREDAHCHTWRGEPTVSRGLSEADISRSIDGVANRVDRARAIGNGQFPAMVATTWSLLT